MICIQCGKEFEGQGRAKYCSGACKIRHHRGKDVTIGEDVTIDSNTPCRVVTIGTYVDVEKDLGLSLSKDLGVSAWNENGVFICPDITIEHVRNIRRLVEAKRGWEPRQYA